MLTWKVSLFVHFGLVSMVSDFGCKKYPDVSPCILCVAVHKATLHVTMFYSHIKLFVIADILFAFSGIDSFKEL